MKKESSESSENTADASSVELRVPAQVAEIVKQIMLAFYERYEPSITLLLNEDMAPITAIVVVPLNPLTRD